jgi:hypothetical protein
VSYVIVTKLNRAALFASSVPRAPVYLQRMVTAMKQCVTTMSRNDPEEIRYTVNLVVDLLEEVRGITPSTYQQPGGVPLTTPDRPK